MSIKSLSQDILSQVEEKKQEFSSFYEQELRNLEEELNREYEQYRVKLAQQFEEEFQKNKLSMLGSAQSRATAIELEAQEKFEKQLKQEVTLRLESLDESSKKEFYKKLFKEVSSQIECSYIECNPKDKSLFETVVSKKTLIKTNSSINGGFIAYTKDKSQSIDVSFSTILDEVFQDYVCEES